MLPNRSSNFQSSIKNHLISKKKLQSILRESPILRSTPSKEKNQQIEDNDLNSERLDYLVGDALQSMMMELKV